VIAAVDVRLLGPWLDTLDPCEACSVVAHWTAMESPAVRENCSTSTWD